MKLRFTRRAECELERVQDYHERLTGSSEQILDEFDRAFKHLLRWPRTGHHRLEFLSAEHRFWRVESYFLIYVVQDPWLVIVSIVHASRDLAKELELL